jgi:hypothetical protein
MMLAKMAGEGEASAQRLPSVKTAPERKFGSIGEVVGERAAAADASEMSLELWRRKILGEHGELALGSSGLKSIDHEKQVDRPIGKTDGGKTGRMIG